MAALNASTLYENGISFEITKICGGSTLNGKNIAQRIKNTNCSTLLIICGCLIQITRAAYINPNPRNVIIDKINIYKPISGFTATKNPVNEYIIKIIHSIITESTIVALMPLAISINHCFTGAKKICSKVPVLCSQKILIPIAHIASENIKNIVEPHNIEPVNRYILFPFPLGPAYGMTAKTKIKIQKIVDTNWPKKFSGYLMTIRNSFFIIAKKDFK